MTASSTSAFENILWQLSPTNWNVDAVLSNLFMAVTWDLPVLLILLLAISLLSLLPALEKHNALFLSGGVVAYCVIRFFSALNIWFFALLAAYVILAILKVVVTSQNDAHLYTLCHIEDGDKDAVPPIPYSKTSQAILLSYNQTEELPTVHRVFNALAGGFYAFLQVLPLLYIGYAFMQLELLPTFSVIGLLLGLFIIALALAGLVKSSADLKKHEEALHKIQLGQYPIYGRFKSTQNPFLYYEWVFIAGLVVSGSLLYLGIGQWFLALFGLFLVTARFLREAGRQERIRYHRFSGNAGFKNYAHITPVFFTFLPLYTISKPFADIGEKSGNPPPEGVAGAKPSGKKEKSEKVPKDKPAKAAKAKSEKPKKEKAEKPKKEKKEKKGKKEK